MKELAALTVRGSLGEILERVFYNGDEYVIKRGKKAMAVLIPVTLYESLLKLRENNEKQAISFQQSVTGSKGRWCPISSV